MSSLKSQSPLKHPQTHTFLPSPFAMAGQSQNVPIRSTTLQKKKKSAAHFSQFLSVIHDRLVFHCPQHHQLCPRNLQFLIQNHVAPSHGSPARVLSPLSLPVRSPIVPTPSPALSLLRSSKLLRESSAWMLHLAFLLPKSHG